jgi:hypothetical protein
MASVNVRSALNETLVDVVLTVTVGESTNDFMVVEVLVDAEMIDVPSAVDVMLYERRALGEKK